jgi:hypothetical protein
MRKVIESMINEGLDATSPLNNLSSQYKGILNSINSLSDYFIKALEERSVYSYYSDINNSSAEISVSSLRFDKLVLNFDGTSHSKVVCSSWGKKIDLYSGTNKIREKVTSTSTRDIPITPGKSYDALRDLSLYSYTRKDVEQKLKTDLGLVWDELNNSVRDLNNMTRDEFINIYFKNMTDYLV